MKPAALARILYDQYINREPRRIYYSIHKNLARAYRLLRSPSPGLVKHVFRNQLQFMFGVDPIQGETTPRVTAAVEWLLRACRTTLDGGLSLGYFPCDPSCGWKPSYPEATGYVIPTLLESSRLYGNPLVRRWALELAQWEISVQLDSGAIQAGPISENTPKVAAVFNTGMVLDGWVAAYRAGGDESLLKAARKAADFLLVDLSQEGHFRSHGNLVSPSPIKTYNVLCAWALYRFGEIWPDGVCKEAALRVADAAVGQQHSNGWFANNCLTNQKAPLLHTIGYTLQGILELGILSARPELIESARKGVDPLIARTSEKGFLHGCFYSDWEPAVFSSCLTGCAQLAVVCYRLHEYSGDAQYLKAGDLLVNHLKALQTLDSTDPGINGALAGSFPFFGCYMTAGYPSWATKFFVDALILQDRLSSTPIGGRETRQGICPDENGEALVHGVSSEIERNNPSRRPG
ncbi:MAG: hypothetical protein L0387_08590 [Acidobacteria bacterium]|nr:hypothetical protein [Acidobacteriota bacterium]MCI0718400.1 hypothetical protein [Acidobacteriota bacterium]